VWVDTLGSLNPIGGQATAQPSDILVEDSKLRALAIFYSIEHPFNFDHLHLSA
jgi:hypothetical protein